MTKLEEGWGIAANDNENKWLMFHIYAFYRLIHEADGEFAIQPEVGNKAIRTMNTLRMIKECTSMNDWKNALKVLKWTRKAFKADEARDRAAIRKVRRDRAAIQNRKCRRSKRTGN